MQIRRREFLAIAPAGALASGTLSAGTALAGPCGAGGLHAVHDDVSPVGLGFWEGSGAAAVGEGFELPAGDHPEIALQGDQEVPRLASAVFDARALPAGDPRFLLGPARLRVLGLIAGVSPVAPALPSLSLRVLSDPERDYGHDLWSFQNGAVPSASSPIEVTVPVQRSDGLHLAVAVTSPEGERAAGLRLSLGIGAGPKLRRGLYLLSWGGAGATAWQRFGFAALEPTAPAREPAAYRLVGQGLDPAPLDGAVLAFTVDFAHDLVT